MQGIPVHKKANLPQGQYISCGFERVLFFPALLNTLNTSKYHQSLVQLFILYVIVKSALAVKTNSFYKLACFLL